MLFREGQVLLQVSLYGLLYIYEKMDSGIHVVYTAAYTENGEEKVRICFELPSYSDFKSAVCAVQGVYAIEGM